MAYRRKLIEVSLPLEAINAESIRRKQKAPKGFPTSLHKYWAQRPIAACRAVLIAQLIDDPSAWPELFPTVVEQEAERARLHDVIRVALPWDATEHDLHAARLEIARSVARSRGDSLPGNWLSVRHRSDVIDFLQAHAPAVHDPFSGSGSIPLEAQRLGLRARGSDLNPVAVLISKALIEFPPKFAGRAPVNPKADAHDDWSGARGLADDVRFYGRWMREQAARRIGHLYPKARLPDGGEATVIAWLWARTVPSPDPRANGAHVPLASSFLLSAKAGREAIVVPVVDRATMTWRFEVNTDPTAKEIKAAKDGTKVSRGYFGCVLTGTPITYEQIDDHANAYGLGARLMAVVAEGTKGRVYLTPTQEHERLALSVERPDIPEVEQPCRGTFASNAQGRRYGFDTFADYFTPRQLVALTTFSDLVADAREAVLADAAERWPHLAADTRPLAEAGTGPTAYADAVATYLALVVDRMVFYGATLCRWLPKDNAMGQAMGQQAVAMTWDFAEGNPLGQSSSDILTCTKAIADCIEATPAVAPATITCEPAQARRHSAGDLISTDPPYYDNVGYADLSDFFYVWLRRSLLSIHGELFRRALTPKREELVATPYRHEGQGNAEAFFMRGMGEVMSAIASSDPTEPTTIYYAYKQSELRGEGMSSPGWAAFLQALVDAGFVIDGTWPIRSESAGRLIAQGSNALASSIVLVCRCRPADAPSTTKADFLRQLRREMPAALADIRAGGVGPTDIPQAAFGPGIGVFTRYASILNPDGTPLTVDDALNLVSKVREEIASGDDADYDAPTRFALDWFAGHGFGEGASGAAITMANALGLGLDDLRAAGVATSVGGKTRLLGVADMAAGWDPAKDATPTAWEACHHLVRLLTAEDGGIDAAAALHARLGGLAEPARALSMRLYDLADGKGLTGQAFGYKSLYDDWPTIEARAAELGTVAPPSAGRVQGELL